MWNKTSLNQGTFFRNIPMIKKINLSFLLLFFVFFLSGCGIFDSLDADMNKAIKKKDPKLCLKMTEDVSRKERCLSAVAEAKEDVSVCDMIEAEKEKDFCVSKVAIVKGDAGICESITNDSKKGICYNTIAKSSSNENLCEKIPSERTQGDCYKDIAIEKNDEAICDKIKDTFNGPHCYIAIAKSKNDASICEKIEGNASNIAGCYEGLATQNEDESLCDKIKEDRYRDGCLDALASRKVDISICKKIAVERKKTACVERLASLEDQTEEEESSASSGQEDEDQEGECKFDSDCDAICEDGVYWKMGCNARTDSCEKTFETDCFAERTSVGSFTFAKSCTTDGCVDNKEKVAAFRDDLSADALKFHNLMQEVERARVQAHNNCLSALSDVTNKFIIDSAITFAGVAGLRSNLSYQSQAQFSKYVQPSGSAVESLATAQVTGPVQGLLDKLGSMAIDDGKPKMKVEDYIDLNCNAAKDLSVEHARLAQERDIIIELAKPMKGW